MTNLHSVTSENHILSLAVLQTPSLGHAYEIFQMAALANLQVLEVSPLGTMGHVIVEGSEKALFDFLLHIKSELFTSDENNSEDSPSLAPSLTVKLCHVDSEIIETYLSIKQGSLQDHLLIVEGAFLGDLFEAAMALKQEGFIVLDLRAPKTEPAHCFGFFSISQEKWTVDVQLKINGLVPEPLKLKLIENPHPDLRSYFEL